VLPGSGRAGWEVEDLGNVALLESSVVCKLFTKQANAATLQACQALQSPFPLSITLSPDVP